MSIGLVWSNILAYSLQIGLLVGLGALVPAALRLRMPRARLLYWQVLLVACLALPWVRGWRQEVVAGTLQVSTVITAVSSVPVPVHRAIPLMAIALWLLAAGVALRLGLLVVGLARLGAYRRRGQELPPELRLPGSLARASLLVSGDVSGPVTFGWRSPVILLPAGFPALDGEMRDAIVCHELMHVERRDWLFTIAEELVRAVLWFHPAIWWVIGEIQLAREQTVDQSVIEMTQARGPYVDTLLLMSGALSGPGNPAQLDLAPAPMFLRRRHLKRRLLEVVKEVGMTTISKTRLVCLMSAAVVLVGAGCWLATGAFPLSAAPQTVDDAAGVAVNTNGSQLMHRSLVPYPAEALAKGIEGTVVVQLRLDANAEVSDAAVLSGPDELRKSVLQSVLKWHFDKSAASSIRTVNLDFVKPVATPQSVQFQRQAMGSSGGFGFGRGGRGGSGGMGGSPLPKPNVAGKLDQIVVTGLSDTARTELLAVLPVQEGSEWSGQGTDFLAVRTAATKFDSHLTVGLSRSSAGGYVLHIGIPNSGQGLTPITFTANSGMGGGAGLGGAGSAGQVAAVFPPSSGVYSVGNGTSPPSVLSKVDPQYTEEARLAKYSGSVMLSIVVNTDGKAEDIKLVRALGMGLDEKAIECVQQWAFRPGMNNGIPVNVRAQIEINFRLLQKD